MTRTALLALLTLSACAADDALPALPEATETSAPSLGKADGTDGSDRECNVVLRDVARPSNNMGGYESQCVGSSCTYVWAGHVDVSSAAVAEAATVGVLYHLAWDSSWYEVPAIADGEGAPGMTRYSFRMFEHLVGPGMSYSSLNNTRIELVPFLRTASGGRLFDHNRNAGDLDNYLLTIDNGWRVVDDGVACMATEPNSATVSFTADWNETVSGTIQAGGTLNVVFDLARLPSCRATHNGYPAWDTEAYVKFYPGEPLVVGSVRQFESPNGYPTNSVLPRTLSATVPAGTTGVEIWFKNYSGAGNSCETWDSNLGENYRFDVTAGPGAPEWMGNVGVQISRAASAPCTDDVALTSEVRYDSWARTRATYANVCFEAYEPGVTDWQNPDLWQELDVQMHYRFDDGAFEMAYVGTIGFEGNNAVYALPLAAFDPFRLYHCPDVPFVTTSSASGAEQLDVATMELYFTVNGVELRPAPGQAYVVTYENYAGASSAYCQ